MKRNQATYPVLMMSRVLGVSPSGYYAWIERPTSARAVEDGQLTELIRSIHGGSRGTYGVPRIHFELAQQGKHVGRKRVARLMVAAGLAGVSRRKGVRTTRSNPDATAAQDLVQRDFSAEQPNQLWVADITYIPTWAGFLYLAVILDVYSRRVIGWAMATHLRAELVIAALDMAIQTRRPVDVIHHSDHGSQYTSIAFGKRCEKDGVRPSMGSVGDCYDNALMESFFATLECELIDRTTFRTPKEAEPIVFEYIEAFYNRYRRHSALGYLSPAEFERRAI